MQCVYYDDRLPNGFEEQFFFSPQMPYTIQVKRFQTEDIVPLHYAETIEILLCDDLEGKVVIDNHHFSLTGQQMFVIPPYTAHANIVRRGKGIMYVIKINFEEMDRYIQVRNLLFLRNCTLSQLDYKCDAYDAVMEVVTQLIRQDGDLFACIGQVLKLFEILSMYADPNRSPEQAVSRFRGFSLQEMIRWTHENFARKITIEEAAQISGYSKYHFCSRFKALTGMTYMHYLNTVRVSKACIMLRSGESVQNVCRNCGFENVSHFIQLFKRIQHITPHQYAVQVRTLNESENDLPPDSRL